MFGSEVSVLTLQKGLWVSLTGLVVLGRFTVLRHSFCLPPPCFLLNNIRDNLKIQTQNSSKGLNLSEKILFGHLINLDKVPKRGKSYVELQPDRVAMQDATAQMALLQFALTGRSEAAVPSTVHCDHLIQARVGRDSDLADANKESSEVFSFLKSASAAFRLPS